MLHNIILSLDVFSLLAGFGCGLMFSYGIFLSTSLRRYEATIKEYEQDLWRDEQDAYNEYLRNDVPEFDPDARQFEEGLKHIRF